MFSAFPSLHPLIIHFPVVLILISVVFQAFCVWKDYEQIRWATFFLMTAGFFSAWAASTVFHADPSEDAPKAALEMFEQHELYAKYTLWASGLTMVLKAIGMLFKKNGRLFQIMVLVVSMISALFLSIAGHHGARLTHIAGVGPMGRFLEKEHGSMKKMENMPSMKEMEKGNNVNAKGKSKMDNMKDMGPMDNMNGPEKQNTQKEDPKNEMSDMKGMGNMNGGKGHQSQPSKANMKGMEGMKMADDKKSMKMPDMDMKNTMDTFQFDDNNPAFEHKKKSK